MPLTLPQELEDIKLSVPLIGPDRCSANAFQKVVENFNPALRVSTGPSLTSQVFKVLGEGLVLAGGVVKRAVEQRRQEKEAVETLTSLLKETSKKPPAAGGVGGAVAEKKQEAKKELGEWREAIDASSGEVYYWNTVTREASWTLPSSSDSTSSRK
mmetsp:Transcript_10630/g.35584  ORF Transcript_10630/g.35584 Transcript_10630/m.35584 type:complete len:156 (-) Transcript_10630:2124-2591(-)